MVTRVLWEPGLHRQLPGMTRIQEICWAESGAIRTRFIMRQASHRIGFYICQEINMRRWAYICGVDQGPYD
jgi:hypothetical protein